MKKSKSRLLYLRDLRVGGLYRASPEYYLILYQRFNDYGILSAGCRPIPLGEIEISSVLFLGPSCTFANKLWFLGEEGQMLRMYMDPILPFPVEEIYETMSREVSEK